MNYFLNDDGTVHTKISSSLAPGLTSEFTEICSETNKLKKITSMAEVTGLLNIICIAAVSHRVSLGDMSRRDKQTI